METLVGPDFQKKVIPLIQNAKREIDIVSYDWRWYGDRPAHATQQLNIELVNASKRGVRVRAVLNTADQATFLHTLGS